MYIWKSILYFLATIILYIFPHLFYILFLVYFFYAYRFFIGFFSFFLFFFFCDFFFSIQAIAMYHLFYNSYFPFWAMNSSKIFSLGMLSTRQALLLVIWHLWILGFKSSYTVRNHIAAHQYKYVIKFDFEYYSLASLDIVSTALVCHWVVFRNLKP